MRNKQSVNMDIMVGRFGIVKLGRTQYAPPTIQSDKIREKKHAQDQYPVAFLKAFYCHPSFTLAGSE